MGRESFFAIGALIAGAAVYGFYVADSVRVPNPFAWLKAEISAQLEPTPVIVFIVGSRENVATIRRAIDEDRIVADTGTAFALDQGRIVAANADVAGTPVSEAGWIHRPVEVFFPPKRRSSVTRGPEREDEDGEELDASSPTLSAGETLRLLNQLE